MITIWLLSALLSTVINASCDFKFWRYDNTPSYTDYQLLPVGSLATNVELIAFLQANNNLIQPLGEWDTGNNCFYIGGGMPCLIALTINGASQRTFYPGTDYTMTPWGSAQYQTLPVALQMIDDVTVSVTVDETMAIYSKCNTGPCTDVVCADTGNACTENVCVAGSCVVQTFSAGHSCSDNDACNGLEACDGSGVCQSGISVVCDDGNVCTDDTCDSGTGNCVFSAVAEGTQCSDGDGCNGIEICDAAGVCFPGSDVVCPIGQTCQSPAGTCVYECGEFAIDDYSEVCSVSYDNSEIDARFGEVNSRIDNLIVTDGAQTSPIFSLDFLNKDLLIIGLLISNIFLCVYICVLIGKVKGNNYKTVPVYRADEENKPINL